MTATLFTVAGVNRRTGPVELRERLYVEDEAVPALLDRLQATGLAEAMVLCTCDRVEVWGVGSAPQAGEAAFDVLAESAGLDPRTLLPQRFLETGEAAQRHAFAVASSLDSEVIGEPQVLGQVKAAHRLARDAGRVGPVLEPILQAAYQAAKRVRTETAIGQRPVSLAAAACQLARDVQGDLSRCRALLIGAGDMGEFLMQQLLSSGLGDAMVVARTARRAESLARRLGCHYALLEELPDRLAEADIIVACQGEGRYMLSADMVEGALRRRRRRPVFLVDLAVPGDIEPAVNRLDDAFLYDLDELEQVALQGRAGREAEAGAAWAILEAELAGFRQRQAERDAVPALVALRAGFEAARQAVLAELPPDDPARPALDRATQLLVNRLLHRPMAELRRMAVTGEEQAAAESLLRRLFPDVPVDEMPGDTKDEE
ncbi:glutamyl-tRNA reductase [Oceanibaculum indicum]|uniref:Glutamyl-tRNA reductase n=1 Tax=Oceanibaculum indicum TaxID=526216 RepID=A0A420WG01_9PROT|nr:glutamyl-tRNA reductase [Oceanibaculum indicum]RKQ69892.1 glutamyl-tRNA reductase [Oceanibaculum indicum]